jgi:hypothetical protein
MDPSIEGWVIPRAEVCLLRSLCSPTREHVIPRWYNDTPGDAELFSARAPLTHLRGDLLVKDVCEDCNSGVLSNLDDYGKGLYCRYFAKPVYACETVEFDYDGELLIRWLLKLSFNSARAQNADIRVLHELRKVILGQSPPTDHVRCWLYLVPPTLLDPIEGPRPARREEANDPDIDEPLWFRIAQFRLPSYPALGLTQRIVFVNAFAFTLLVAPADSEWPSEEFNQWVRVFTDSYPTAKPIMSGAEVVSMTTSKNHAAVTYNWLFQHYPST